MRQRKRGREGRSKEGGRERKIGRNKEKREMREG